MTPKTKREKWEQYRPLVEAWTEWKAAHYAFYCPTIDEQSLESRRKATERLGAAEACLVTLTLPEASR